MTDINNIYYTAFSTTSLDQIQSKTLLDRHLITSSMDLQEPVIRSRKGFENGTWIDVPASDGRPITGLW